MDNTHHMTKTNHNSSPSPFGSDELKADRHCEFSYFLFLEKSGKLQLCHFFIKTVATAAVHLKVVNFLLLILLLLPLCELFIPCL